MSTSPGCSRVKTRDILMLIAAFIVCAMEASSVGASFTHLPVISCLGKGRSLAANRIPARLQWNANSGYCGETSFIQAGAYYGQFCGQFTARALASPGVPQSDASAQLLLGQNDAYAAKAMRLEGVAWAGQRTSKAFLLWVRGHVLLGHPVIIGVYNNENLVYSKPSGSNAGDASYDHIVTVTGVETTTSAYNSSVYLSTDVLLFDDHGLYTGGNTNSTTFRLPFGNCVRSRRDANLANGPVYSLSNPRNYGFAVTGVAPVKGPLPVTVQISGIAEIPELEDGSDTAPEPERLTLTVTVSGLHQRQRFVLYRYSAFSMVQKSAAGAARNAVRSWNVAATAESWSISEVVLSSDVAVYRAYSITGVV